MAENVANDSEGVQTGPVEASAIRQSAPSESSVANEHCGDVQPHDRHEYFVGFRCHYCPGSPGCTGSRFCEAETHIHGCFADRGDCDEPGDHHTVARGHERYPTRLTCCAWCGRRIPGAVTDKTKRGARRDPLWTRAARVACPAHRDLVMALDVYYNGEPHDR